MGAAEPPLQESGWSGRHPHGRETRRIGVCMADIPIEFLLFAFTLLGVALLHHRTLEVAAAGLVAITLYKLLFGSFGGVTGLEGLAAHLSHEWVIVANLGCLLLGFALLSRHFEKSHVPLALPHVLPDDWRGAFLLLAIVFVLSSFLDNIAGALIGGAMARSLFKKLHIGYLAAIVAASNAGGAGSVVGDTTTTMMWIDGVAPQAVFPAYVAALTALFVFGLPASRQQQRFSPIVKDVKHRPNIDWIRVGIVVAILVAAIGANVIMNVGLADVAGTFPLIGVAVWVVILLSAPIRRPDWHLLTEASRGTAFLLSLVIAASMMPVEHTAGAVLADGVRHGLRLCGVRQYPFDETGPRSGRLRLGRLGLLRRLRWLDDLVWILGGSGPVESVSARLAQLAHGFDMAGMCQSHMSWVSS